MRLRFHWAVEFVKWYVGVKCSGGSLLGLSKELFERVNVNTRHVRDTFVILMLWYVVCTWIGIVFVAMSMIIMSIVAAVVAIVVMILIGIRIGGRRIGIRNVP